MNGAESLVRTLVGGGVEVCFANPGTSEMHFVAALDRVDGTRCVLGLSPRASACRGPASPTWTASTAALPRAWRRRAPISSRSSLDPDRQSDASRGPLRPVCGQTGRSSVSTGAPKIIDFAPPGWPLPTQLSRYQCRLLAAAMGQFDPFPRLELNGRCRTRKRSFAGDD